MVLGFSLHYHEVLPPSTPPQALAASPALLVAVLALVLGSAALGGLATYGLTLLIEVS